MKKKTQSLGEIWTYDSCTLDERFANQATEHSSSLQGSWVQISFELFTGKEFYSFQYSWK